jgi:hypothetical protein
MPAAQPISHLSGALPFCVAFLIFAAPPFDEADAPHTFFPIQQIPVKHGWFCDMDVVF